MRLARRLTPTLLMRPALLEPGEWDAAQQAAARWRVRVTDSVVDCANALVVSRLATWPFYHEVVRDLARLNSRLVQSAEAHRAVVDMQWADLLGPSITPPVYRDLRDVPRNSGPWVVKGQVTSRKLRWNEEMFAPTWDDVIRIRGLLERDTLIGQQPIVVRPYAPLRILDRGLFDLPFANEHRCVYWRGQLLGHGFYWAGMTEETAELAPEGRQFADQAAQQLASPIPLAVLDVAQRADGSWLLVEVNDLQQSGFGALNLADVYERLCAALAAEAAE